MKRVLFLFEDSIMFIPNEYGLALFIAILCAICWGSWGNPARASRQRFELFYIDYAFTSMIVSFFFAITLGSWNYQGNAETLSSNFREASSLSIFLALLAGLAANIGNMLLVAGVDMIGLAASFPLQGGTFFMYPF